MGHRPARELADELEENLGYPVMYEELGRYMCKVAGDDIVAALRRLAEIDEGGGTRGVRTVDGDDG